MSRNETRADTDRAGRASPGRALVAVAATRSGMTPRPRPLSAFLAQLATSDAPRPPRVLRAPAAMRHYAEAAALLAD